MADDESTVPPEQILRHARQMASEGVLLEAIQQYESYVEHIPDDALARNELSALLFTVERYTDAADHALLVLDQNPDNKQAVDRLRKTLKKLDRLATDEEPSSILQLARITRWSGKNKDALSPYTRYLALEPNDADARYEYAQVLAALGRADEAMIELKRTMEAKPDQPELPLTMALWLSYSKEGLDEARTILEALVKSHPDMADAHAQLGDVYRFTHLPDKAKTAYTEALKAEPGHKRAKEGMREVRLQRRPLELARKANWAKNYSTSAQQYERHFEEMASIEEQLRALKGKTSAALSDDQQQDISDLEHYVANTPPAHEIRMEYAEVLAQAGRSVDAIAELKQLASERPGDRDVRMTLARHMSYSQEHLMDAQIELEKIVEDFEGDAEAEALRGDVYRYRGKLSQAFTAYNKSLNVNPGFARASEGIEAVEDLLRPQLFLQAGYTHDRSTEFKHYMAGPQYRRYLQSGNIVVDLRYRYHAYEQEVANINPTLGTVSEVTGHEIAATASADLGLNWSVFGQLGFVSYDEAEDAVIGEGGLTYTGDDLAFSVGGRESQIVSEHYDLNALLDDVNSSDFFVDLHYFLKGNHWLTRWDIEAHLVTGSFSDDNGRTRIAGHLLHVAHYTSDLQIKYGLGARYQAYDEESPNYFSPDSYTGYGPALRIDHNLTERVSWGASGLAYYIDEAGEYDLQGGGYIYYLLDDGLEVGVRADHGESTSDNDDIQTTSAFGEMRYAF